MTKRRLPHVHIPAVLDGLRTCRAAMIALSAGSPPRSLQKAAADQMIRNIDELAWILSGNRDAFIVEGHGSALSSPRLPPHDGDSAKNADRHEDIEGGAEERSSER